MHIWRVLCNCSTLFLSLVNRCAVVQVTALSNAEVVKQRPPQATSGSAPGPKRKDRTVKLHKMCVRKVGKLIAGWKRKSRKQ